MNNRSQAFAGPWCRSRPDACNNREPHQHHDDFRQSQVESALGENRVQQRNRSEVNKLSRHKRLQKYRRLWPPAYKFAQPWSCESKQKENDGEACGVPSCSSSPCLIPPEQPEAECDDHTIGDNRECDQLT